MQQGQYLTFKLQNSSYAVGIESIREINRMTDISAVPESPDFVAGVINLRGKVITVVDLRKRLQVAQTDITKETCIVVLDSEVGFVGVIVDSVQAVIQLQENQIDSCPVSENRDSFVKGIGKVENNLIMLLDVKKCLLKQDLMIVKSAA